MLRVPITVDLECHSPNVYYWLFANPLMILKYLFSNSMVDCKDDFELLNESLSLLPLSWFQSSLVIDLQNQRTNGPVNAHLISWPSKAQNIQNLENIW